MVGAFDVSVLEACEPTAPLSPPELTLLSDWLDNFESDNGKRLAIDRGYRLWNDYARFGEQNRCALILLSKLSTCLTVPVTAPAGSPPQMGAAWAHLDSHRAWLLGVALNAPAHVSIVNATHANWEASRLPRTTP